MVKETSTALAAITPGGYLDTLRDFSDMKDVIRDNMGDEKLDEFSLPRIRVPAGGGIAWAIPTLEGAVVTQEISGVIVYWKTMRAYWEQGLGEGGGNAPPDCSSRDGRIGIGDPGGECAVCPLNEFGSKDGGSGRGKACKEVRALFLLREGGIYPTFIPLPPMSIGPMKQYFLDLAGARMNYWKVVTSLRLEQARNADGITYSKATPTFVRRLEDEEIELVSQYKMEFQPAIEGVVIEREDVSQSA